MVTAAGSLLPHYALRSVSATSSHSFVTFRGHIWTMIEDSPYTLSPSTIAVIAIVYLLFILLLVVFAR